MPGRKRTALKMVGAVPSRCLAGAVYDPLAMGASLSNTDTLVGSLTAIASKVHCLVAQLLVERDATGLFLAEESMHV